MNLNLPILDKLEGCKNILIAGAGGGFDVFAGLPIVHELEKEFNVLLANYTGNRIEMRLATPADYPEGTLNSFGSGCYLFGRLGVKALTACYVQIVAKHQIDAIILVDGGVDSLMRGVEEGTGTILEDSVSLAAVDAVNVPVKLLACLGFGTETEEGLCHYRALENIASLAAEGAFFGSCALTEQMPAYKYYEEVCLAAWEHGRKSHIHSKIIPAVCGHFGDEAVYESDPNLAHVEDNPIFINPLMSLYWFFDLPKVVERNQVVDKIKNSTTFVDVHMLYRQSLTELNENKLPFKKIPL